MALELKTKESQIFIKIRGIRKEKRIAGVGFEPTTSGL